MTFNFILDLSFRVTNSKPWQHHCTLMILDFRLVQADVRSKTQMCMGDFDLDLRLRLLLILNSDSIDVHRYFKISDLRFRLLLRLKLR